MTDTIKYPHLFEPLYVKSSKIPFKNRILSAPNGIYRGFGLDNGILNYFGLEYFGDIARGGTASVNLPVMISTDPDEEYGSLVDPNKLNQSKMYMLQKVVHAYRSKSFIEFYHTGRCAASMVNKDIPNLGSTEGVYQGYRVKGMDEEDMQFVINQHVELAIRSKAAGFDGITLHYGHGWLVHDFLSPLSNHRTDEYGGSVENRVRFPLRLVKAVREAVGNDTIIELRLDGCDEVEGGIMPEDCAKQVLLLQDYVDMIHITCGTRIDNSTRGKMSPTYILPKNHNVWASEIVKKTPGVKIPIGVVGYIATPEDAEQIIAEGKADYILMARSLIADPEWANKARCGKSEDICPCLRCDTCLDHGRRKAIFEGKELSIIDHPSYEGRCAVNPFSHQGICKKMFPAPDVIKKVAVIGGGVAGMNAAIAAADHGHSVTLYEGGRELGGQIRFTDEMEFKKELKQYHEYLERRVKNNKNITLKLGVRATPEMIKSENYDAAIVAVGAKQTIPDIKGIEKATPSFGALKKADKFGKKILIIGGSFVGSELALHFASKGHEVTVVERTGNILPTCELSLRVSLLQEIENRNIECIVSTEVTEVTDKGVVVFSSDGEKEISADSVIFAVGSTALTELRDSFADVAFEVINVGDALDDVKDVPNAVDTGYNAGYVL